MTIHIQRRWSYLFHLQPKVKSTLQAVIAEELYEYRKEHALSQVQFAQKLQISVRSYIDLEHGMFLPSATTLLLFQLQLDDQELLCFLSSVEETLRS